jgi:hypothetical protein
VFATDAGGPDFLINRSTELLPYAGANRIRFKGYFSVDAPFFHFNK